MNRLLGVLILLFFTTIIYSQLPVTEAQAQNQIELLGLDEEVVRQKLLIRGIDINNIDQTNPSEMLQLEKALEEIADEIAQEEILLKEAQDGEISDARLQRLDEIQTADDATQVAFDTLAPILNDSTIKTIEVIEKSDLDLEEVESFLDAKNNLPPSSIFGQHIFRDKNIGTFRQSEDIKAPDSYVIGVGDIIGISIFGRSQASYVYEINKAGHIKPTGMGPIYIKGINFGDAKKLLQRRFSQYYNFLPEEFQVTLNYSRTITINIVGEVENYGSYTIPAINTAFNALIISGGPSNIGSVRKIRIQRSGEPTQTIDVYTYLLDPDTKKEYYLQENDFIYVPVAERLVTIRGAIKRPFTFELIEGEHLNKLIEYSGGFTDNAYLDNITIRRLIGDEPHIIDIDYNELRKNNTDYILQKGDEVTIRSTKKVLKNYVNIGGEVEYPGGYQFIPGMKLSDLIAKGILTESSRKDVAFLQRRSLQNGKIRYMKINLNEVIDQKNSNKDILLQRQDRLIVYSEKTAVRNREIQVVGAVYTPVKYPLTYGEEITIEEAILLARGLRPNAYDIAYIRRTNLANSQEEEFIKIDLKTAIENPESGANINLVPGDILIVYSKESFSDKFQVSITGAVRKPGTLTYDENLTINDMIVMSQGLRLDATDFGYLIRKDPTDNQFKEYIRLDIKAIVEDPDSKANLKLAPSDIIEVYSKLSYVDDFYVQVEGAVRSPGKYQYAEQFTLKDALEISGGLKLEAASNRIDIFRIVMNENEPTEKIVASVEVDSNLNILNTGSSFQLQPYDIIVVRTIPDFDLQDVITVSGEVKYPGVYALISDNEKLLNLLERSGGLTIRAFPEGATLYRPSEGIGYIITDLTEVLKNQKSRYNFILRDGDIIEIPQKKDLVTITGATKADEIYSDRILSEGKLNVAYHKNKNAKWYIKKYGAGIGKSGSKKLITVEHPNGEVESTRSFLFFKNYPSVRKGSIVNVGIQPPKEKRRRGADGRERTVDWGRVVADTIAQATAVLSLVLLLQNTVN